jgi:hypothetical protein
VVERSGLLGERLLIFAWLEQTWLSVWIREAPTLWAFPFVLFLHTLGLGVVGGLSVAINAWVLALAARKPIAPLERFFPLIWHGFTLALVSGLLLLLAYPTKALTNPVFYLKMALMIAALIELQWLRKAAFVTADPAQPFHADGRMRIAAAVSIACWIGVVATGRFLAYTHTYLTAADMLEAG